MGDASMSGPRLHLKFKAVIEGRSALDAWHDMAILLPFNPFVLLELRL
jgi:hypothetical protein